MSELESGIRFLEERKMGMGDMKLTCLALGTSHLCHGFLPMRCQTGTVAVSLKPWLKATITLVSSGKSHFRGLLTLQLLSLLL